MYIERLIVRGYKILENLDIKLNEKMNIFVGENDSGKSSVLEAIQIATRGRLGRTSIDSLISPNIFSKCNRDSYIKALWDEGKSLLPSILIEIYFRDEERKYSILRGTNNSLSLDYPGIRIKIEFDNTYSNIYQTMLENKQVKDIPVEYYKVSKNYFSGEMINYRAPLYRVELMDTYRHDYSNTTDRYISSVLDSYLTEDEKVVIKASYNQALSDFRNNETVCNIIKTIRLDSLDDVHFGATEIQAKNDVLQTISEKLEIIHEEVPLSYSGTGTQNLIQAALYIDCKNSLHALMIEEPENNLSFSNLHRLIQIIQKGKQQTFITTHSSYITNHLGLNNVILFYKGHSTSFINLDDSDVEFFHKLPGFDTLRFVLSSKVILTEGPSDELILTRAYFDIKGIEPKSDGIDIISVNGLVFKRFCAIAKVLRKKVSIVTDNDGDIEALRKRYLDIIDSPEMFSIFYDTDETLNTLELSVAYANSKSPDDLEKFLSIISPDKKMDRDNLIKYMLNNKTGWAMKVLESPTRIKYPEHILRAIAWWGD